MELRRPPFVNHYCPRVFDEKLRSHILEGWFQPAHLSVVSSVEHATALLASGADLHTCTVAAVRPGSPAEADGFEKGDLISCKDGKNASEFTLRERDSLSHAGQHHALEVQRSGEQSTKNLDLRLVSIER